MPKEMDLVKQNTIKRYIKDVKGLRISTTSANELRIRINSLLKTVIQAASETAKEEKRSTIMPRDMDPAIEDAFGKKKLNTEDLFTAIKKLNPIELGELTKLVSKHVEKQKEKKK